MSILYLRGLRWPFHNNYVVMSLKIVFSLTKSIDPD